MNIEEQNKDIAESVYDKYIKDLVKKDSEGLYIEPGTLKFDSFTKNEKLFIEGILNSRKIQIRKGKPQKITKEDRSKRVCDLDFGTIEYHELNDIDVPVKSTIEYDNELRISFANFDELDKYLEEEFIPKYIQTKKTRTSQYGEDYQSIQLNHLVDLRLSEDEMIHAMEFLADQGIIVCGKAFIPKDRFENYDYYVTNKTFKHKKRIDNQTLFAYFEALNNPELSKEERSNIRHKIIEANTRIASYVVYKNGYKYNMSQEELLSFALEGLIDAVDSFDVNYGASFFWYAYVCSLNRIKNSVAKASKLPTNLFWTFQRGKRAVESTYLKKYTPNDTEMLNEIIEFLLNIGEISLSNAKTIKKIETAKAAISYEGHGDKISYEQESAMFDEISTKLLREKLDEVLSTLTDREEKILKLRFGLEDGTPYTLDEIGERFDITRERVRQIEAKALRKLRHPSRSKKIKGFLSETPIVNDAFMKISDSADKRARQGIDTFVFEETPKFEYTENALDDLYKYIEKQEKRRAK